MSKNTFAKTVRVVTIPPLLVTSLLVILYIGRPDFFRGVLDLLAGIAFLAIIPTLAYPLQPIIPGFKGKGRKGQRTLAFITSGIGYIGGMLYALISRVSPELFLIFGSCSRLTPFLARTAAASSSERRWCSGTSSCLSTLNEIFSAKLFTCFNPDRSSGNWF